MRLFTKCLCAAVLAAVAVPLTAETITEFNDTLGAASATEAGRPARYGMPQDWAGDEPYPDLAPGTAANAYHYKTYTLNSLLFAAAPYLEITLTDIAEQTNLFLSAYSNAYDPANRAANWLGDQGTYSSYVPGAPDQFELLLPPNANLVLVLTQTDANDSFGGTSNPYNVGVYGFTDASFDEPAPASPVPEPPSLALLATGLCCALVTLLRQAAARASVNG